nr:hypothetical protein [uncultured Campylobacter sp.]
MLCLTRLLLFAARLAVKFSAWTDASHKQRASKFCAYVHAPSRAPVDKDSAPCGYDDASGEAGIIMQSRIYALQSG